MLSRNYEEPDYVIPRSSFLLEALERKNLEARMTSYTAIPRGYIMDLASLLHSPEIPQHYSDQPAHPTTLTLTAMSSSASNTFSGEPS